MKFLANFLAVALFFGACAAACTDGDTQRIPGKCDKYQLCKNGSWEEAKCLPLVQKYSKTENKCVWWFQSDCSSTPQCSGDSLLKSPYSCRSYYQCDDGELKAKSCWPLFNFDGTQCKFWGSCDTSVSEDGDVNARENENYADPCSGDDSEPIANHCHWYKTCGSDGFFQETSCPIGKYFNAETKSCDWFWKVNCDVTKCDGKARAPANSDGNTYYQCVDGYLMKKKCGWLHKFDDEKGQCVFSMSNLQFEAARNASKTILQNSSIVQNSAGSKQIENTRAKRSVDVRAINGSCPTNGAYQSHPNCLMFYECIDNKWVARNCSAAMIFSNGQCRFQWKAQCDPGSCIANTKSADPSDCTRYIECDANNNQVTVSCGKPWVGHYRFDPSKSECVWGWSECTSASSYVTVCPEGGRYDPRTKMCLKP
ncbi:Chitin Hypothetical protein Peritrophin-A domain [Nesidiocoris tenuis]|uniref:Chitin-binding type-2 domain-containing protein n=1 Tax=Nesidiocoris tenuis TaxID=355587 RepID=A0ABN7BDZ5_9HEMI|nr:Chitin Hypothetical protein Peritrophin-A domain [Nesidiocoris tenuis]